MPAPRFVTSDNFGAPGLYFREITPPGAIGGTLNRALGIAGQCVRGPVGRVVEINSPGRFEEVYGARDYGSGGTLIGEVWKSLLNKPVGRQLIARVAAAAAVTASFDWETAAGGGGTAVLRIAATSPGLWGNDVQFKISAATNGVANAFNLTVKWGTRQKLYENLDITTTLDNTASVVGDDDGNLVVLTKLAAGRPVNTAAGVDGADSNAFVNLGETVAAFTSVAGTEGSIADSDFTAANGPMEQLANYKGVGVVFVAGRSVAAIKTKLATLAAASNDRLFLACPDSSSVTLASAITEVGTLARHQRLVYCFNHVRTLDPQTAQLITTEPHAWMAAILNQTDADVHPGVTEGRAMLGGIAALTFENLAPGDYDSADAAGINALERGETGGFGWVSGVTTDLAGAQKQIVVRRQRDYLNSLCASVLQDSLYKPNTKSRRVADKSDLESALGGLAKQERYVALQSDGSPAVEVQNELDVNSQTDWDNNIHKTLVRAKLISHNLVMVLLVEIGTTVKFIELA